MIRVQQSALFDQLARSQAPEVPGRPSGIDYLELLSPGAEQLHGEQVEELLELARLWADETHHKQHEGHGALWVPIHAWRALEQIQEDRLAQVFIDTIDTFATRDEAWRSCEIPALCGQLSCETMPLWEAFLLDPAHQPEARTCAVYCLLRLASNTPDEEERIAKVYATQLRTLDAQVPQVNAHCVEGLLNLSALTHAETIKSAFDAQVIDERICGSWAQVAEGLGLVPASDTKPAKGHSLVKRDASSPIMPTRRKPPLTANDKATRKRKKQARKKNRRTRK